MTTLLDDFNRADNATVGAAYTARAGAMRITGNAALPGATGMFTVSEAVTDMASNDHYAKAIVKQLGTSSALMLYVRSSASHDIYGYFQPGQNVVINTNPAAYAFGGTTRANSSSPLTVVAGDELSFEAVGNLYVCKKNGVAIPGAAWTDTGAAAYPYQDASHRKTGFGMYISTAGDSIDTWGAGDIGGTSQTDFFMDAA